VQDLLAGKTPEDTDYVKHIAIDQTNVENYITD